MYNYDMKQYHSFVEFVKCTFSWSRKFVDSSKTNQQIIMKSVYSILNGMFFFLTNLKISVTACLNITCLFQIYKSFATSNPLLHPTFCYLLPFYNILNTFLLHFTFLLHSCEILHLTFLLHSCDSLSTSSCMTRNLAFRKRIVASVNKNM